MAGPPTTMATTRARRRRALGLARYLSLVLYKTYAELRAESVRTYIGYAWWAVEPVVSMGVYYLVFEWILDRGTENYAAFLIVGLVPWRWLSTGILRGAGSILAAHPLMQQVHIPKVVFPLVSVLSDTVKFAVVFTLLVVFVALAGFPVGAPYLALPLVIGVQGLVIVALTLVVAAVTPFLPDIRMVLESVVRLWLFLSGIFYTVDSLPETLSLYIRLNPMTTVIASYRDVLLYGRWPDAGSLALIGVASLVVGLAGAQLIRRNDFLYPKLQG